MMSNKVNIEDHGKYVVITICRPEVHNALDPETHAAMDHALNQFEQNPNQLVAIVTGQGTKAFCAGGDISAMAKAEVLEDYAVPRNGYGGMTCRKSSKPIIAAVNGLAMGGGFEMVLAADIAIASEHAVFALPEARIGTAAVAGGMHRLPRMIGMKRALEIQLTGRTISAEQALQWGLLNQVVSADELLPAAIALAEDIIRSAPLAIRAILQASKGGMQYSDEFAAMKAQDMGEFPAVQRMLTSSDVKEGLAAFLEKRLPHWKET